MNKTKIEWCDYTWNPVTGCLHGCDYCYARKFAKRFGIDGSAPGVLRVSFNPKYPGVWEQYEKPKNPFPHIFKPTFHRYRLDEPQKIKIPSKIFVCSMADLFEDWVPDEWIEEVFKACEKAPQHQYLFLTKNYNRYMQIINSGLITVRDNYWFGTTITTPQGEVYRRGDGINTFVSIEPILERFNGCRDLSLLPDWVIIGAETGNRKGKVIPEKRWVDNIVTACKEADIPVFMKNSLKEIMGDDFIQEWPERMGLK